MEKEIWKDISNYEGYYKVSNFGRIKSLERTIIQTNGHPMTIKEKIMNGHFHKDGYKQVELRKDNKRKTFFIHRLVAETFINEKRDDQDQVNHKNGKKDDNHYLNLEWCTGKENVIHSHENNLINKDEEYYLRLNEHARKMREKRRKKVLQIHPEDNSIIKEFNSLSEAAKFHNGDPSFLSKVLKGKRKTFKGFKWRYDN
ncbi:hypothetical protein Goe21_00080 [Bacillus phage vB_BsuM-Goe21]|nr:hypothetical protein Goe21_00080 [Bacillus phage vB_BsuM-Goe21]